MAERQNLAAVPTPRRSRRRPRGAQARGRAAGRMHRSRPKDRIRGLRIPLYVNGIPCKRISVAPGSLVEIAVHELGARLVAVDEDNPAP